MYLSNKSQQNKCTERILTPATAANWRTNADSEIMNAQLQKNEAGKHLLL